MARLTGEVYDAARELFEETCRDGGQRCQSFSKTRLRKLREKYGDDLVGATPRELALAQCGSHARTGSTVCYHHGAGGIKKPGGRPVEHGGYSRDMPRNLLRRYEMALADPGLIELREETSVMVTLIADVLKQYGNFSPDLDELGDAMTTLGESLRAEALDDAQAAYLTMYEIFNASKGQWGILRELRQLVEQRRKLTATEIRRLEALNQLLTIQEAMAFQAAVLHIVKQVLNKLESMNCPYCKKSLQSYEVSELRAWVIDEFRKLATRSTRGPLLGGKSG